MQLLEHFNELSLHPKNAKELKGLILELALRGNLTNNFSNTRKKGNKDIVKGYFELPQDWYWDKFDNLCDFQMGRTPPSKELMYWEGEHPWISIADMQTYATVNETKKTLSEKGLKNYFKDGLVQKGTLIMSFKLSIGKTSYLGVDACHNEAIISIYPNEKVLKEYLFLFLPVISHWGVQVNALMGKTLNKGKIENMNIPIPPLEEQKAIVEVVNQLFAEVDQLESLTKERITLKEDFVASALKQLSIGDTSAEWAFLKEHFSTFFTEKANIKKLRECILQLAVQGKLTSDWRRLNPDVENAKVLLERIKKEKKQLVKEKKIKKENPLPKISDEEIPYELPEGWVWCRIDSIADNKKGALKAGPFGSSLKKEFYTESGYKIYGQEQVITNDHTIGDYYIDEERFLSLKSCEVAPRDILISLVGTVGKVLILPDEIEKGIINPRLIKVSLHKQISPQYFKLFLYSPFLKSFIAENSQGSTMNIINLSILKLISIPLPSFEEQQAIVNKVSSLMVLCDELEAAIETSKTTQEKWMESSLREVFEPK
jgi:type I restriction enzyme S subunit